MLVMNRSDTAFLNALESGQIANANFGHRDHLRAAWIYVVRDGTTEAIRAMERTIRRFAAHHGQSNKFHMTLTVVWVTLVAVHAACHRQSSFDRFLAINGELLDKDLPLRFYSRERLFGDGARSEWLAPDLRRLPDVG
jgi:hypothetical protein